MQLLQAPGKEVRHGLSDINFRRGIEENQEVLNELLTIMKETKEHQKTEEDSKKIITEWVLVARVIDRYLFIMFAIVAISLNVMIFVGSQYGSSNVDLE